MLSVMEGSPQQRVFRILELFELILDQVDTRTLLVAAQRVSRHWHHFISASPVLQEALFFKPRRTSWNKLVPNPFLLEALPFVVKNRGQAELVGGMGSYRPIQGCMEWQMPVHLDHHTAVFASSPPTASWRRMLMCQPELDLTWRSSDAHYESTEFESIHSKLVMNTAYDFGPTVMDSLPMTVTIDWLPDLLEIFVYCINTEHDRRLFKWQKFPVVKQGGKRAFGQEVVSTSMEVGLVPLRCAA